MTRILRTEAICLRLAPTSQTSRVITWLSPTHGKLSTLVKGSCRPKSAFLGQFDLYYTCELLFYARPGGDLHIARECAPLNTRDGLRTRWRATGAASYLCDLCAFACQPELEAAETYGSLACALDALARGADPLTILLWFETHTLCHQGLSPAFEACPRCRREPSEPSPRRFSLGDGRLVCPHAPASGQTDDTVLLPMPVIETLNAWRKPTPPDKTPPHPETLLALRRFLGMFIRMHLEPLSESRRIALEMLL